MPRNQIRPVWSRAAWGGAILMTVLIFAVLGRARPMSIDLLSADDPQHTGFVTRMTVRVHNSGHSYAQPKFTVISSFPFPVMWHVRTGPKHIPPGTTVTYTIESPADGGIPSGDEAIVRVNDAHSKVFGVSRPVEALLGNSPALLNSTLRAWTFNSATGQPAPIGWMTDGIRSPLGEKLRLVPATIAGHYGMRFVNYGAAPRWEGIRVDQDVNDPQRVARLFQYGITVSVYPTFSSTHGYGPRSLGEPGNVFGIQLYADAQWLWIVFSDENDRWDAQRGAAVLTLHAPLHQWSSHYVDIRALYRRLSWAEPREMIFSFLVSWDGRTSAGLWPAFGPIQIGRSN